MEKRQPTFVFRVDFMGNCEYNIARMYNILNTLMEEFFNEKKHFKPNISVEKPKIL